jgi:hypothetical protein
MIIVSDTTPLRYLALLIVLTFAFTNSSVAIRQGSDKPAPQTSEVKGGLQLSAEIENEAVAIERVIHLRKQLRNVSQAPITICKRRYWDFNFYFSVGIFDEKGIGLGPTFIFEYRDEPPLSEEDFITIPPGESIHSRRKIPLGSYDFRDRKPGNYSLVVTFGSLLPKEYFPEKSNPWDNSNGYIKTKPISFRVEHIDHCYKGLPPADFSQIKPPHPLRLKVHDAADWKNPYLVITKDGVIPITLLESNSERKSIRVDELEGFLRKLPLCAWPFGKVVAAREVSIRSGNDSRDIARTKAQVENLLKSIGVGIDWWPS